MTKRREKKNSDSSYKPTLSFYDSLIEDDKNGAERSSLFSYVAISEHLKNLNFSESSIQSMMKCGKDTGFSLDSYDDNPDCENFGKIEKLHLLHDCNLRICPRCSEKRKRRLFRSYFPLFKDIKETKKEFIYFLTISPKNYDSLNEGFLHIKTIWKKFMRYQEKDKKTGEIFRISDQFVKDKVTGEKILKVKGMLRGGFYVIEVKQHWKGQQKYNRYGQLIDEFYNKDSWNIHIHAVVHGQYLDNAIRGKCNKCNQNYMHKDYVTGKICCANKNCRSFDVVLKRDGNSRIVSIFNKIGQRDCNIRVDRLTEAKNSNFEQTNKNKTDLKYTLNYLLKYVSSNKGDFKDSKSLAEYINLITNQKMIVKFGSFHGKKIKKKKFLCNLCGNVKTYFPYSYESLQFRHKIRDFGWFVNKGLMKPFKKYKVNLDHYNPQKKIEDFVDFDFISLDNFSVNNIYDFVGDIV